MYGPGEEQNICVEHDIIYIHNDLQNTIFYV